MHLVSWRGCEHVWRRADNEDVQPETGDRQQDGGVTALRRRQVKGLGGGPVGRLLSGPGGPGG